MPDDPNQNPFNYLKEIGAVFKLGSGVLGKSAIAIGLLIVVGGIAIFRIKSDAGILLALGVMFAAFFLWFFPVIRFVEKHPESALLESGEWMEYHRFRAAAKGYTPSEKDQQPTLSPGSAPLVLADVTPRKPDEESR